MQEFENQTEQSSEVEENLDEEFFFEEDSQDEYNQPTNDISKSYSELQKKFTQTAQEKAKLEKERAELAKKAQKLSEYEQKEQEAQRKAEIDDFSKKYEGLPQSAVRAIAGLQKWSEKTLEEIASEYGFLEEMEANATHSGSPKGRSFVLPGKADATPVVDKSVMRKMGFKTSAEIDKIRADFGI